MTNEISEEPKPAYNEDELVEMVKNALAVLDNPERGCLPVEEIPLSSYHSDAEAILQTLKPYLGPPERLVEIASVVQKNEALRQENERLRGALKDVVDCGLSLAGAGRKSPTECLAVIAGKQANIAKQALTGKDGE